MKFIFLFCLLNPLLLFSQDTVIDSASQLIVEPISQPIKLKEDPLQLVKPNPKDTLAHYKQLLQQKGNDADKTAQYQVKLADLYFQDKKDKEALIHLLSAQKIYVKLNNKLGLAQISIRLAAFYERNSNPQKAEKNYLDAVLSFEELQDEYSASKAATHLSFIYFRKKEYKDALKYASYSLDGYRNLDIKDSSAAAYVQMATINKAIKNYRVAEILILKQALSLYRSSGNKRGRIRCFDLLGNIYYEQKRYSEAKWFFLQANTLARTLNDTENIILSLVNVGKVKIEIKDYALARKDFKEAQHLAQQKGYVSYMARVASAYSAYYTQTEKPGLAKTAKSTSVVLNKTVEKQKREDRKSAEKLMSDATLALTRPQVSTQKPEIKKTTENSSSYMLVLIFSVLFILAFVILLRFYKKN